ncbi:MAG TPA: CvpA family protein [Kiritimatiellia bacterium]|nr:CvpA family protein [Kiritimatiellia bacterium]
MNYLPSWLNPVDAAVAIILLVGLIGGVRRGLSGELARLITFVAAIYLAWLLAPLAANAFAEEKGIPTHEMFVISFVALLIVLYILLGVIRWILHFVLDFSFRGKLEIYGGALFGLSRYLIFCSVALLLLSKAPSEGVQALLQGSVSQAAIERFIQPAHQRLSDRFPALRIPEQDDEDLYIDRRLQEWKRDLDLDIPWLLDE